MKRFCAAVVVLVVGGIAPLAHAAPPTVTPSPGYEAAGAARRIGNDPPTCRPHVASGSAASYQAQALIHADAVRARSARDDGLAGKVVPRREV
jgi:hypothetical protein